MVSKKDYSELLNYLEDNQISPQDVLVEVKKMTEPNPNNHRSVWKMMRFTLYLWERYKEYDNRTLGTKAKTIEKVVNSGEYQRLYATFSLPKYNAKKEQNNLYKLVTDPRQFLFFKSKNFVFHKSNPKKNIPQAIIDKIR